MINKKNPPIIGISGASGAGKDLLCNYIRTMFCDRYSVDCIRKSIAGDLIKKDLSLILNQHNINPFTENREEKEIIRPMMIEYGILMRKKTKGRYFIERFETEKNKINIIPDIRFAEYEKDELSWLKKEKKGVLVFIERTGYKDNNKNEEFNNPILKKNADYILRWDDIIGVENGKEKAMTKVNDLCNFLHRKICITNYQLDISQPLTMS